MKLSWRRSRDIPANPGRSLTGPARAAALGVSAAVEDDEPLGEDAAAAAAPTSAAPTSPGPVMLTLTTRSRIEEAEQEATAVRPVRRRLERGAMGGRVSPTGDHGSGGACGAGGCG